METTRELDAMHDQACRDAAVFISELSHRYNYIVIVVVIVDIIIVIIIILLFITTTTIIISMQNGGVE